MVCDAQLKRGEADARGVGDVVRRTEDIAATPSVYLKTSPASGVRHKRGCFVAAGHSSNKRRHERIKRVRCDREVLRMRFKGG